MKFTARCHFAIRTDTEEKDDSGSVKFTITNGVIDVLYRKGSAWHIIDYKTKNIDDEHYDEQLNGYRRYIESVSNKKADCYLYSILDNEYRKV